MSNPLKDQLIDRFTKLQTLRSERAADFAAQLARLDQQISELRTLAQQWDTMTVDQALAAVERAGIHFDLKG